MQLSLDQQLERLRQDIREGAFDLIVQDLLDEWAFDDTVQVKLVADSTVLKSPTIVAVAFSLYGYTSSTRVLGKFCETVSNIVTYVWNMQVYGQHGGPELRCKEREDNAAL